MASRVNFGQPAINLLFSLSQEVSVRVMNQIMKLMPLHIYIYIYIYISFCIYRFDVIVGIRIVPAVLMMSSVFRDITPYIR
jgi:hypothetical protein